MAVNTITPSLTFDGKASRAIQVYERALGAKVERLMRFADGVALGRPCPESHRDHVMHALLRVGGGMLMVMDAPPGVPVASASNVQVALDLDDPADLERRFDALAAGGVVTVAPHDAFWGGRFGMLIDAFGIRSIFNCATKRG